MSDSPGDQPAMSRVTLRSSFPPEKLHRRRPAAWEREAADAREGMRHPLLYNCIRRIEGDWSLFNCRRLDIRDILAWIRRLGVHAIADYSIRHAMAFVWKGERVIVYNPWLPMAEKVLAICHEIGHVLLGHLDLAPEHHFAHESLFGRAGMEKDASIIGYLCLLPTIELSRLHAQARLTPDELLPVLDPWRELGEDYALSLCTARMRIFRSFLKYVRKTTVGGGPGSI